MMTKKIYRTWRDKLPLWFFYALIAAVLAVVLLFIGPRIVAFLRGLDWSVFGQEKGMYLRWILQGLVVTLRISAISMVLAMVLGTIVAVGRLSHSRIFRWSCTAFVEFFRNTPLLVQIFFWYFGTSTLLDAIAALFGLGGGFLPGPSAFLQAQVIALKDAFNKGQSEFIAGIVGLTVYTASFIAEIVRAGITSIHHGQTEAARASGLSAMQTLRFVILPQALRIVVPPLITQFLNLTKNSSQAMAIGVAEMTYMARQVEANTFKGFEAFTIATGIYMAMSFLISYILNRYDHAISIPQLMRKKQRVLAQRDARFGYAFGWIFALVAAVSGALLLWAGGHLLVQKSWGSGLVLDLLGFLALAAAVVAVGRPSWGLTVIRSAISLGGVVLFFSLLRQCDAMLCVAETPLSRLGWPASTGIVYAAAALFWWHYFSKREPMFLYRGGGNR
jgi:polar amino acid transport system permease protein